MRYLLIVLAVAFLVAALIGVVHHDYGGIPFLVIGAVALFFALRKPA